MKLLDRIKILIKFSRFHTILGTILGSATIFLLSVNGFEHLSLRNIMVFSSFIIPSLLINLYVVGLNQIYDTEIDMINKPDLPIAARELNIRNAWIIVIFALVASIILSLWNKILITTMIIMAVIGYIYSVPPFRIRNNYYLASLLIILGRGIILNLSAYLYFSDTIPNHKDLHYDLYFIILIISIYTLVISLFKDLPDTEGDTKFHIKTSPVLFGIDKAFSINIALLGINYLLAILSFVFFIEIKFKIIILLYHILIIGILIIAKIKQKAIIGSITSLQKFYKWIWNSFYLEYLVILVAFS